MRNCIFLLIPQLCFVLNLIQKLSMDKQSGLDAVTQHSVYSTISAPRYRFGRLIRSDILPLNQHVWHRLESVGFDLLLLSHFTFLPRSLADLLILTQASCLWSAKGELVLRFSMLRY